MNVFKTLIVIFGLTTSISSAAYLTVGESGELIKPGQYVVGVEPQVDFTNSGFNFAAFAGAPYGDDGSLRAKVGFGYVNFETSLSYKWIPVPDYDQQPAVGAKFEALYANKGGSSTTALRLMPLLSKKYETENGTFIPYGSIPLNFIFATEKNSTGYQLVVGTEYSHPELDQWSFGGEFGTNLGSSVTYISGTATFYFDESGLRSNKIKTKR